MGFKEILTKTKVCCLDCSVSLLLFPNIWKFIYLAELSIQKKKTNSAQVDRTLLFSSMCACYLGRGKCAKEKEMKWRAEDPESWEL